MCCWIHNQLAELMEMVNESSGKHQKLDQVESGIGRFPDSILCKILYHLHTKDAAATSVLAKRWRFLWTHVQYLEFDSADFGPDSVDRISFPEIVNRVLLLHNARCLEGISLRSDRGFNEDQFDSWIRAVIARSIEAIDLCFIDRVRVPDCLFKCNTLVDLMLQKCFCRVPRPACLPSLKRIRFEDVEFENDESLPNLISGCLLLTDLDIDEYGGMLRCNISSPSLRHIDLRVKRRNPRTSGPEQRKLVLDTPALRCLTIKDGLSQHLSAGTLRLVLKADLDLQNYGMKEDISYAHALFAFIERLYNVKSLKLSSHPVMRFLDTPLLSPSSRFDYLTKLDWKADWRLLTKLLQFADKLEVLTIREVDFSLQCWGAPEHIPVCLLSSLQTVSFFGFGGGNNDFDMLRYILRHAKVLKTMKLYHRYHGTDTNSKFKILQQISRFPRGSDACEIDFY